MCEDIRPDDVFYPVVMTPMGKVLLIGSTMTDAREREIAARWASGNVARADHRQISAQMSKTVSLPVLYRRRDLIRCHCKSPLPVIAGKRITSRGGGGSFCSHARVRARGFLDCLLPYAIRGRAPFFNFF